MLQTLQHGARQQSISSQSYRHKVAKLVGELCPNAAVDNLQHLTLVIDINWEAEIIDDLDGVLQGFNIAPDNDSGVHISAEERLRHVQHLSSCMQQQIVLTHAQYSKLVKQARLTQDNDRGCAITDLFVLCSAQFNHGLHITTCVKITVLQVETQKVA